MLGHDHVGGTEAVRGEMLGDHLMGMHRTVGEGSFFNVCTGTCREDNVGGVGGHYCAGGMEWGLLRGGRGGIC